jgi:hypothetical protein
MPAGQSGNSDVVAPSITPSRLPTEYRPIPPVHGASITEHRYP